MLSTIRNVAILGLVGLVASVSTLRATAEENTPPNSAPAFSQPMVLATDGQTTLLGVMASQEAVGTNIVITATVNGATYPVGAMTLSMGMNTMSVEGVGQSAFAVEDYQGGIGN